MTKMNFNFMGYRRITALMSSIFVLISIISLFARGLDLGLDFTSGTSVRMSFAQSVNINDISSKLSADGYDDAVVVSLGSDRDISVILGVDESIDQEDQASQAVEVGEKIAALMQSGSQSEVVLLGSDYVSAKVGTELAEQGGLGMLVALAIITVYIAIRFQFKFSVGAVVALGHDLIITLGIFSLTGMEFNLNTLAAMLAIIGY